MLFCCGSILVTIYAYIGGRGVAKRWHDDKGEGGALDTPKKWWGHLWTAPKRCTLTLNLQLASKLEWKAATYGFPMASSSPYVVEFGPIQFPTEASWSGLRLSYREIIVCRYIGVYRIEPPMSSISIFSKTSDFFFFFRRKFRKFGENSENPWTKVLNNNNNAENSKKLPKIPKNLKIRRKFLKKKVFFGSTPVWTIP